MQRDAISLPDRLHAGRKALTLRLGIWQPQNVKHEVIGHAKSALDKSYIQEIPLADRAGNFKGAIQPNEEHRLCDDDIHQKHSGSLRILVRPLVT